jgi:hypothetical protein
MLEVGGRADIDFVVTALSTGPLASFLWLAATQQHGSASITPPHRQSPRPERCRCLPPAFSSRAYSAGDGARSHETPRCPTVVDPGINLRSRSTSSSSSVGDDWQRSRMEGRLGGKKAGVVLDRKIAVNLHRI